MCRLNIYYIYGSLYIIHCMNCEKIMEILHKQSELREHSGNLQHFVLVLQW